MKQISEKLITIRKNHQLNQSQVAKILHVSRKTISNWENNRGIPDLQSLMTLSELYQVPLSYFTGKSSDKIPQHNSNHDIYTKIAKFSYFFNLLLFILCIVNFFLVGSEHLFWVTPITIINFCIFIAFYQNWNNLITKTLTKKIIIISIILFILANLFSFGIQFGYDIKNTPAIIFGIFIHSFTITASFDFMIFGYKF